MAAWDDVIDFDNVGDWPMELAEWVKLVNQSVGHQQQAQAQHLVRECLQRSRIKTYHCMRLLESEVEAIKRDGLRPGSTELARDKGEAARAAGRPLPLGTQADPSDQLAAVGLRQRHLVQPTRGTLNVAVGLCIQRKRGLKPPFAPPEPRLLADVCVDKPKSGSVRLLSGGFTNNMPRIARA